MSQEKTAQEQVRAVGGRWDKGKKLWIVPYGCIAGTKLERFIHIETLESKPVINELNGKKMKRILITFFVVAAIAYSVPWFLYGAGLSNLTERPSKPVIEGLTKQKHRRLGVN